MSVQADTSRLGRLALRFSPSLRRELAMWQALNGMAENMATLAQLATAIRDRLEDIQASNLREWNCRCPRCVADEAKYTGPDPREQDEAARHAAGGARETSEGDGG